MLQERHMPEPIFALGVVVFLSIAARNIFEMLLARRNQRGPRNG